MCWSIKAMDDYLSQRMYWKYVKTYNICAEISFLGLHATINEGVELESLGSLFINIDNKRTY